MSIIGEARRYTISVRCVVGLRISALPIAFNSRNLIPIRLIEVKIDIKEISLMFTIYGGACMFVPLLITPVLTNYFSVRQVFRTSCTAVILIYFATPFTTLLPRPTNFIVLSILLVLKGFITDFAFSTGSVLLQRSCKFEMGRGRLNGLQVMGTAAARVIGPTWGGSAFVLGINHGMIGLGFWLAPMTIAILALVPLAMLEDQ
jgi:MFS family permease